MFLGWWTRPPRESLRKFVWRTLADKSWQLANLLPAAKFWKEESRNVRNPWLILKLKSHKNRYTVYSCFSETLLSKPLHYLSPFLVPQHETPVLCNRISCIWCSGTRKGFGQCGGPDTRAETPQPGIGGGRWPAPDMWEATLLLNGSCPLDYPNSQ